MEQGVRGRRVLVTGSAGVIGQALLRLLKDRDAVILSTDRYPLPHGRFEGIRHVQRDIAAAPLYELHEFQPEVIFHLAAAFERSKESPEFWKVNWHDNVLLSHWLVEMAKELDALKVFVFASSYLIYSPAIYLSDAPRAEAFRLKEGDPAMPRNITGMAKLYTEQELAFVQTYCRPSLRVVNARIFRVYGRGSRDVVSRWTRTSIQGGRVDLYNKQNRFDYIFADDVAEGLLRLAESGRAKGIVNLGSGTARGVTDIIDLLPAGKLRIRNLGVREPFEASCADVTRLRKMTGWVPLTDLKTGIKVVHDYEKGRSCAARGLGGE